MTGIATVMIVAAIAWLIGGWGGAHTAVAVSLFGVVGVALAATLVRCIQVTGENRRLRQTMDAQASQDPLTGLANRALFRDRLARELQSPQRDGRSVAAMVIDLDDFQLVNDSFGHAAGDALLVEAARRMRNCLVAGDTLARLGGDQFAIVTQGQPEQAHLIAHRVVEAFGEPFLIDGHDLLVRPSVGLAVAAADDPDSTPDALLKQADVAMYSAKRARSGVRSFTPDMYMVYPNETDPGRMPGASPESVRLLGELRRAIDDGGLSLVYQPKFDLRDNAIVGVEALVRWTHPEHGLIGPDRFLPLVREHGLMRSVTEFVFAQALDDVVLWRAKGIEVPVAVNVFAPSLEDLGLPKQIENALARRRLRTDTLTVEITEDALLENMDRTRTVVDRLRGRGIRVAIDDFGSGYSALSYLHDLPIDELKLDHHFIAAVLVDWRAAAIVRAVIDLAHVLGVTTVAEGVETAAAAARLREQGCDVAQGYYYSPPLNASGIVDLVSATASVPGATKSN